MGILLYLAWFLSGFIPSVGVWNAFFKNEYPTLDSTEERVMNLATGCAWSMGSLLLGPGQALLAFFLSGFAKHGFDLTLKPPYTKAEW